MHVAECSGRGAWLPHRQEPAEDRGECAARSNREPTAKHCILTDAVISSCYELLGQWNLET